MLNVKKILCVVIPMFGVLGMLSAGCGTTEQPQEDDHVGVADQALTAEQCNYFAVNGSVQICHRTASVTKPYTILKVSEQACVNAHALHAGDYVAVNDPQCQGSGCLPHDAPCDPTVPCCDGFSCTNGTCTPNVSDHCSPSPCQNGGSCVNDASGYTCDCPAGYIGSNCEIEIDECESNPCMNGQCLDGINSYVCECAPGYTGTNCDIDIDDCANSPCLNGGTCVDGVNGYTCQCPSGWSGSNCEQPVLDCPCAGLPTWDAVLASSPPTTPPLVDGTSGVLYSQPNSTPAYLIGSVRSDHGIGFLPSRNMCIARDYNTNAISYTMDITADQVEACAAIVRDWARPQQPPPM